MEKCDWAGNGNFGIVIITALQKVKNLYDISVVVCARFLAALKIDTVLGFLRHYYYFFNILNKHFHVRNLWRF